MKKLKFITILSSSLALLTMMSCQKEPIASFILEDTLVNIEDTVMFINTSVDADTYLWDFGDGHKSIETSPIHIYTEKGIYTISLIAFSKNEKAQNIAQKTITVYDPSSYFIGTDSIIVNLGSTDADVLAFVTTSDGSAVTVSGIDYNKVGEHTATFKAGKITETKIVKVKANAIAGRYYISVFDSDNKELTQGNGWKIVIMAGDAYNQINIHSTIETGSGAIFTDIDELVVTFNSKNNPIIEDYEGGFIFQTTPSSATWKFSDITYGLNTNGEYAINGFKMVGHTEGYQDSHFTVAFKKIQ